MSKIIEIIKTFNVQLALKNIFTKIDEIIKKLNDNEPKYKVYTVLLTQEGINNPPTAIELENNLGTITYQYIQTGNYRVVSSGLFVQDKTYISLSNVKGGVSIVRYFNQNRIDIDVRDITSSENPSSNDLLDKTSFEIRVYN